MLHRQDVEIWHDRALTSGSDWRDGIDSAIDDAVAAVLLLSPYFFDSEFIRRNELPRLHGRMREHKLKVIPIVVEECAWREVEWIQKLQVCMVRDRPLAEAGPSDVATVFTRLVSEIIAHLETVPPIVQRPAPAGTNIGVARTTFIGRERELHELQALLRSDEIRLITLSGSPGLGKTRLAQQLGRELLDFYPGGCWFVNLVVAVTLTGIAHAIAQTFNVSVASGQISDQDAIVEVLKHRERSLVILDNFEQVVDRAEESVGYWLERLPNITFVVTSREILGIAGEHEYRLETLPLPAAAWEGEDPSDILHYESARLFIDRARAAWPQLVLDTPTAAAVARICVQLDGIPLAIELAAEKVRIFTATEIADRLHAKFSLLHSPRRGAPDRQQTLRASIDWSFQLLKPWEQHAFLQLCIFRGGFFLDAAERIVGLSTFDAAPPVREVVQSLFDKSLINQHQTKYGRRFDMLVSIEDYGEELWHSTATPLQDESLARRRAAYYIPYVQQWNAKVHSIEGLMALDLLTLELENVFEIQDWFLAHGEPTVAAQAILAFSETMDVRGPAHLRVPRLEKSLAAVAGNDELRVRLMTNLSAAHWSLGAWNEATELADEAVKLSAGVHSSAAAAALRQQGRIRTDRGYPRRSLRSLLRAKEVYEELASPSGISVTAGDLAAVFDRLGDFSRSIDLTREAEEMALAASDEAQRALVLNRRGLVLWHHGHPEESLASFQEAERINTVLGATSWIAAHQTNQGLALVDLGEIDRAIERFSSAERTHRKLGTQAWAAVNTGGWGRALMMRGDASDLETALQMFAQAGEVSRRVYYPENISFHAGDMGRCLFLLGRLEEARMAVREAVALERFIGASKDLRHFGNLVTLARIAGRLGRAEECAEALLRASNMLVDGLPVDRNHRVRRVREDCEALEQMNRLAREPEGAEWRIVALLEKHGVRPPSAEELQEIARCVADSFSETSYEYPWTGLEGELKTQGYSTIRLFGYGSLVNKESALRTFSDTGDRFVPAIAFGVVRLFNFEMPDIVRARYPNVRADDPERGLLNVQVTGFLSDLANGVVIEVGIDEVQALREREVGYDLKPIVCIDWNADGTSTPRPTFVLSAPNRLWKGRPLTNPRLKPYRPYMQQCRTGAESFSPSFLGFWLDTTFSADGETRVSE